MNHQDLTVGENSLSSVEESKEDLSVVMENLHRDVHEVQHIHKINEGMGVVGVTDHLGDETLTMEEDISGLEAKQEVQAITHQANLLHDAKGVTDGDKSLKLDNTFSNQQSAHDSHDPQVGGGSLQMDSNHYYEHLQPNPIMVYGIRHDNSISFDSLMSVPLSKEIEEKQAVDNLLQSSRAEASYTHSTEGVSHATYVMQQSQKKETESDAMGMDHLDTREVISPNIVLNSQDNSNFENVSNHSHLMTGASECTLTATSCYDNCVTTVANMGNLSMSAIYHSPTETDSEVALTLASLGNPKVDHLENMTKSCILNQISEHQEIAKTHTFMADMDDNHQFQNLNPQPASVIPQATHIIEKNLKDKEDKPTLVLRSRKIRRTVLNQLRDFIINKQPNQVNTEINKPKKINRKRRRKGTRVLSHTKLKDGNGVQTPSDSMADRQLNKFSVPDKPLQSTSTMNDRSLNTPLLFERSLDTSSMPDKPLDRSSMPNKLLSTSLMPDRPLDITSMSEKLLNTSSLPDRPLNASSMLDRSLNTPSILDRPLSTPLMPDRSLITCSMSDKLLNTCLTSERSLDTPSIPDRPLNTSQVLDRSLIAPSMPDRSLNTPSILDRPLDTPSIPDRPLHTPSMLDRPLNTSSMLDRPLDTPSMSDRALNTSSMLDRPLDTSMMPDRPLDTCSIVTEEPESQKENLLGQLLKASKHCEPASLIPEGVVDDVIPAVGYRIMDMTNLSEMIKMMHKCTGSMGAIVIQEQASLREGAVSQLSVICTGCQEGAVCATSNRTSTLEPWDINARVDQLTSEFNINEDQLQRMLEILGIFYRPIIQVYQPVVQPPAKMEPTPVLPKRKRKRKKTENGNAKLKKQEKQTKEKTLACTVCDQMFAAENHLKKHMQSHDLLLHTCPYCHAYFKKPFNLRQHIKKHQNYKFECSQCQRSFTDKSTLQLHIKSQHEKRYNIECEVCKKKFYHRSHYNEHMRRHTGKKPYSCEQCGKEFAWHDSVKKHMQTHTAESKYKCRLCGRWFRWLQGVRQHLQQQHKLKKCDVESQVVTNVVDTATGIPQFHHQPQPPPGQPTLQPSQQVLQHSQGLSQPPQVLTQPHHQEENPQNGEYHTLQAAASRDDTAAQQTLGLFEVAVVGNQHHGIFHYS